MFKLSDTMRLVLITPERKDERRMKTSANTTYTADGIFDGRYLNVIKLDKVVDCDIALGELAHSIQQIKSDLASGFGDGSWASSARIALADYEHKFRMVTVKKQALVEARQSKPAIPTNLAHALRFYTAAKAHMSKEGFDRIVAIADLERAREEAK